ncbi:MAG: chemotaxis protein CheW [Pirellulales bacterium]
MFSIADFTFGINVAKVREVLPFQEITSLPKSHASVMGVFKLRNRVIPCVSLRKHLGISKTDDALGRQMILTDFNKMQTAFTVDHVERIHRISWEKIMGVPDVMAKGNTPVTAVASIGGKMVSMLDFELIAANVMDEKRELQKFENKLNIARDQYRILVADDSPTVRASIVSMLKNNGYTNLEVFVNGADCWNWIEQRWNETKDVNTVAHLVISDVEMPQIDGFHLTYKIKEHNELKRMPVCLYSSIVSPDNHKKGIAVGADAQLSKPEIDKTIEMADQLITKVWINGTTASQLKPVEIEAPSVSQPVDVEQAPTPSATVIEENVLAPESESIEELQRAVEVPNVAKPAMTKVASQSDSTMDQTEPDILAIYRQELYGRSLAMQEVLTQLLSDGASENYDSNSLLRILHSIKSASQVIPLSEAVDVTHLMEELVQSPDQVTDSHFINKVEMYASWIDDLADLDNDLKAVLSQVSSLQQLIS